MEASQTEQILKFFKDGRTLTQLEALTRFGCFRLGARCYDLKKMGYNIQKRTIKENGKHFAEYWLN